MSSSALAREAYAIAIGLNRPPYDALYLALAKRDAAQIVTFDERLVRTVAGTKYESSRSSAVSPPMHDNERLASNSRRVKKGPSSVIAFRMWAGLSAFLLLAAVPAGAQMIRSSGAPRAQTGSLADGIAVIGFGSLDVPASKAAITVHISSQTPFTVAQIKPLIDDVAKADGSNDSATIPPFIILANAPLRTFTATGTVNNPTAKMLTDAIPPTWPRPSPRRRRGFARQRPGDAVAGRL